MRLFDESGPGLFRNEQVLNPDFLPDMLPHREKELRELASLLRVATAGRKPPNVIIVGDPGTGKTSCAKYVLQQLSEFTKSVVTVYSNCWTSATPSAVISDVSQALELPLPRRGVSIDEVYERIVEELSRSNRTLVVVLDEVDRLVSGGGTDLLYRFSRALEISKVRITVVGITNDHEFLAKADTRVRSSFGHGRMEFNRYSVSQLKDILKERARLAFGAAVVTEDAIALCAANAVKNGGDARLAIGLLHRAGLDAEAKDMKKVDYDNVYSSLGRTAPTKAERKFGEMDEIDQAIVAFLKKNGPTKSGELYKRLKRVSGDRAIRERLVKLEESGVVNSEEVELKPKGRTRIFSLSENS